MGYTQIESARVKPGRMNDVLRLTERAKPTMDRVGGKNYRLYRILVGGPYTGLIYWAIDFDDIANWGSAYDQWRADADWGQTLEQVWGPDGAVVREHSVLLEEDRIYPTTSQPSQAGAAVEVAYWQVHPGRLDDARKATARYVEYVDPFGGHHRVRKQHLGGETTGLYVTTTEFPNMATLGEWLVKFQSDPAVRQFVADWDADPPATRVATMLATRLV